MLDFSAKFDRNSTSKFKKNSKQV